MSDKVFRCLDCGNITKVDKNGDGRCTDCGEIMESTTESELSANDKAVLSEKGDEVLDKQIDLDKGGGDILG
jgi:uncharacterized Zn finger protein